MKRVKGLRKNADMSGGGESLASERAGAFRTSFGKLGIIVCLTALITVLLTGTASAAGTLSDLVTTVFGENAETVDIIILLTVLTLLPSIVMMLTGFTRIIIVLSFIRNALGMQQTPPNQVLIGLALFLTFFVMQPMLSTIYDEAYIPYSNEEITQEEFFERAMEPTRIFMLRQTYTTDLNFFLGLAHVDLTVESTDDTDAVLEDVPDRVLIPSFLTSEIKRAFQIGFFIYIPFIVIDMVVSSTLMAMGMMMLPPAMISLPFKVMLFVLVDGWQLIIGALVNSFG